MQYSVPQFIEVEDKIIGPLTLKQFLYLLGGAGALFALWTIAPTIEVFLVPAIPILGIFLALAFYKVNGRPFIVFLQAAFGYVVRPKVMLWRREYIGVDVKVDTKAKAKEMDKDKVPQIGQKVTESRLRKLSTILDNEGGVDQSIYDLPDSAEVSLEDELEEDKKRQEREQRVDELLGKR